MPAGFVVTQFAGDELAHDIFAMTIDPRGDVVVSGPGYIKILRDENRDGVAEGVKLFSSLPRTGAQGLYFDGNDLLASGDGAVLRFRDADGNGVADGPPTVLRPNMANGEHGIHAIVQGPDGWFYLMHGNSPQPLSFAVNSPATPVAEARQGTVMRFSRDFRVSEAVVHGFRNSYDFDFLPTGQIMVYDSDSERAHHLPGYAPTRVYDVAIGDHQGYMLNGGGRAWIRPDYFPDGTERAIELGRGSPTGVIAYRHRQFPERYRHGIFMACWSLGTIYFVPLTPRGSTFDATAEKFLVATGSDGFAPVDLVVAPSGDLFVAMGGRNTRGGVFRVRHTGGNPPRPIEGDELRQVLAADQPLDAWSRARWVPLARKLGAARFEAAATDGNLGVFERIRATEILVDVFGGLNPAVANRLAQGTEPLVTARAAWALSRSASVEGHALLAKMTAQPAAVVQRAAWEGLLSVPPLSDALVQNVDWRRGLGSDDRRVRRAAILTAQRAGFAGNPTADTEPARVLDSLWLRPREAGQADWMRQALKTYRASTDPKVRLEAVRLLQIGLGDVKIAGLQDDSDLGYTSGAFENVAPEVRTEVAQTVVTGFPSGRRELDFETARLLGMLRADLPGVLPGLASLWTEQSSPDDDLHFLHVAAQLPGRRTPEVTRRTAHALVQLQPKLERQGALTDRLWPLRVKAIFQRLQQADPGFAMALAQDEAFGRPAHSLFVSAMSGPARTAAARKLLARADAEPASWSAELVEVAGQALPASEILPRLRTKFDEPQLRDAIALVMVAHVDPPDRPRLMTTLGSSLQPAVVEKLAVGFAASKTGGGPDEIGVAIKALGRHAATPAAAVALDRLLATWTGREAFSSTGGVTQNLYKPWVDWFTANHPAEAAALGNVGGVNAVEWVGRLGKIEWDKGNATRGAKIYAERSCVTCHAGASRLGPALTGITARFNREDLFLHITQPNLAISPAYAAKEITLKDGTVLFGVPVYESSAAVLLEVAPNSVVRLTGEQIAKTVAARRSPMPEGLLVGLTDADLADFYAYLKTLVAENPR